MSDAKIQGIIVHAEDFTVGPGRALDTDAVSLSIGGQHFALSQTDADKLASALKAAAKPRHA